MARPSSKANLIEAEIIECTILCKAAKLMTPQITHINKAHIINILAKGIHQRMIGIDSKQTIAGGTSYTTASFTGIAVKLTKRMYTY